MPKSSSLSLTMRSKGGKEAATSPLSPRSPGSPPVTSSNDSAAATPTAPYQRMPESPASPKERNDTQSIFSNFSTTKSSSRIPPDSSIRQVADHEMPAPFYTNVRNGGSTPELNRPVHTPTSEGKFALANSMTSDLTATDNRSDITGSEYRTNSGSGRSNDTSDPVAESGNSKRGASKPKKQGMLSRTRSMKNSDGSSTRSKLKPNPPKTLTGPTNTWGSNSDAVPLKTAPLEKGQSWRQNIPFGKLRTHSADRHDTHHDDTSSRRDKVEQSSLASGSYNESRGAALMSSLGSGARKMGERMETARKGMFGKLGRSSSNHERELQIPKEPYQFKVIHLGLIEQTRLTRISQRLEDSRDKTEFWMPALPWRCIEYVDLFAFHICAAD